MEQSSVKILAISDVPSELLWDESARRRLEGIDLILSCGDLPKKYLEYLTNFMNLGNYQFICTFVNFKIRISLN